MTDTLTAVPEQKTSRTRTGFALAITGITVMMAAASAPSPFYPVLQQRLGLDPGTITGIFAVYAVVLLAALLTMGSLSDHLGRRPVISAGFAVLALSVLLFWHADSVGLLYGARALQGLASGILLSALSAAIADLEPANRPGSAAVWNSVAPMAGLAIGAIAAGAVLDVAADPLLVVFAPLVVAFVALAGAAWLAPETWPRHEGWAASLRPRVAIPAPVRRLFLVSAPAVLAGWATGGLFLSLGASIVRTQFGVADHLWQGLAISLLAGSGGVAAFLIRKRSARQITIYGTSALAVGTALTLAALALHSLPAYLVAVIVAGTGFGTAFMGVLRSIAPAVEPGQRAEVFASIYTVAYLAFGVPAVLAGVLVPVLTLGVTAYGYGVAVIVFAAAAALLRVRARA
ncbi:MFS transporter [Agromyces protaetiae]|uniref:MFS transporter n=1 Tax=Agromyces protaetiae TaxID=2509455 RepID=A0A4P6FCJ6_9MICO|nr:MFS transporter [Agromyces protaetiae]QAY72069.1 MFS transporter [Agromyces protaetiae]